jgi:phytoene dehydrogenase-like protein
MKSQTFYDALIVGAGHNGLVAACYLGLAGLRVLVLEKNNAVGGATRSQAIFPGVDARLSVYSYLVSLLPQKILDDLGLRFETRRRAVASYTPVERAGRHTGLLISNVSKAATRESFARFTGDEREYRGYLALEEKLSLFARKVWPTLLEPLISKEDLRKQFQTPAERQAWDYLVERPLAALIEDHLQDDTVRGAVFTDAKIGVATYPEDPTLLQNRTFLYHVIGQGTGEWRVPVGGMGALVDGLARRARELGVTVQTSSEVMAVERVRGGSVVYFVQRGEEAAAKTRWVLFNCASDVANRILPGTYAEEQVEGSVFKINLLLKRLPVLKDPAVSPTDAFAGTFHLYEGYEEMKASYQAARVGAPGERLPGEMYCHSLTDPSILGEGLREQGYHTLTLFGLDAPYRWFSADNESVRDEVCRRYVQAISDFTVEDVRDCLAVDASGAPCIEAVSPVDLETCLGLPRGNIFHGSLSWPFAGTAEEAGTWGVETAYPNVLVCGSSAKRGGAVSGIPGHNAAMKVLIDRKPPIT